MRVYVASSWKNEFYAMVVSTLYAHDHEVWDWRNPPTGGNGFSWQQVNGAYDPNEPIDAEKWYDLLRHPIAQQGFASDLAGLNWCDVGILLHPCGNSAHLEAGWIAGRGKKVHVLALEKVRPDLMVLALNGEIFSDLETLCFHLK